MSPAQLAADLARIYWGDFWLMEAVDAADVPGAAEWVRLRKRHEADGKPVIEASRQAMIDMAAAAIESWVSHGTLDSESGSA